MLSIDVVWFGTDQRLLTCTFCRSFMKLYNTLSLLSQTILARAENAILEVSPDGKDLKPQSDEADGLGETRRWRGRGMRWIIGYLARGMAERE